MMIQRASGVDGPLVGPRSSFASVPVWALPVLVPSVVLGLGVLLASQHLSWTSPVSFAAPPEAASAHDAARAATRAALGARTGAFTARPARAAAAAPAVDPEFGDQVQPVAPRIPATPIAEVLRAARDGSGREDPFGVLGQVDPGSIVPLPPPVVRKVMVIPRLVHLVPTPKPTVAPPVRRPPDWAVRGLFNLGREQVALLESGDTQREARVGEVLEDGSQVVEITSTQVVLLKQGVRYVKLMGGAEDETR